MPNRDGTPIPSHCQKVEFGRWRYECGCSLIAPDIVLTTASCVKDLDALKDLAV